MTVSPVDGSLRYGDQLGRGFKRWAGRRNGAKDAAPLSRSQLDKYSMRAILDVLGITIQEYMRRTEAQKDRLLSTAIEHLDNVVKAKDAVPLSGKRLNAAAEGLKQKHDDIDHNMERQWMLKNGTVRSAYNATHQLIVNLVHEAESLLNKAKLDDDPAYWKAKLERAKVAIKKSEELARQGDYGMAVAVQEGAFTLAHTVIDKMRNSGRSRGRDMKISTGASSVWEAMNSSQRELALLGNGVNASQARHWSSETSWIRLPDHVRAAFIASKPSMVKGQDSTTRRSRLHRALDRVLDSARAKDACYPCLDDKPHQWVNHKGVVCCKRCGIARDQGGGVVLGASGEAYTEASIAKILRHKRARDDAPRPGMLGVNVDKAKSLQAGLERKGYEYLFPMGPAQTPDEAMIRHAFRKRGDPPQYKTLNERANGYHNVTDV